MQLRDLDVVKYLNGANSIRDGYLVNLSYSEGDIKTASMVRLTFNVPRGADGNAYELELSGLVGFEYNFCYEYTPQQIEMVKCLRTDEGHFFLSLDPWKESEAFISKKDNDYFRSKSVKLTVMRSPDIM